MSVIHKNKSGFTLIEVVLVLAIGGLIFLLAFLAFQQVSGNRRDSERRAVVRQILADAETFASNSNGSYPCEDDAANWMCNASASWPAFRADFINSANYKNPLGEAYAFYHYNGSHTTAITDWWLANQDVVGRTIMSIRASCEDGRLVSRTTNPPGSYGVWMRLEKGSYCADNS